MTDAKRNSRHMRNSRYDDFIANNDGSNERFLIHGSSFSSRTTYSLFSYETEVDTNADNI